MTSHATIRQAAYTWGIARPTLEASPTEGRSLSDREFGPGRPRQNAVPVRLNPVRQRAEGASPESASSSAGRLRAHGGRTASAPQFPEADMTSERPSDRAIALNQTVDSQLDGLARVDMDGTNHHSPRQLCGPRAFGRYREGSQPTSPVRPGRASRQRLALGRVEGHLAAMATTGSGGAAFPSCFKRCRAQPSSGRLDGSC
jgi:hypothetical protein